ncbi:SIS domain-containing protein [Microcella alkaliphila]|uniref:Glutamine--fructose-6-phosphate aminotransferase [isomerizing] n=1 Tax=Microcella alkaliphila TaxID=279828 RepID=A0A4Q7TT17_9MICO|nr:SIS domain-containing protein [Microcella alkaliphila]RZT64151.1 SIS domain-containing protein [Microcella alkaliphila]
MDTARFADDLAAIPASFATLADALAHADDGAALLERLAPSRVLILGMGSSRYAAGRVARAARARGQHVVDELASTDELPAPADDLAVVAISATGGSAEVLHAVERYRGTGRLVAVTNRPESALAEAADAVSLLHAGVEESGVACRTYRHTHVVLERLLTLAAADTVRAELERAAAATEALFDSRDAWLDPLAELLLSPAGTHVLAPAERLCSAQQSALMVRELPRRLAVACETGDWAHVDLYTARTHDYRAAVFPGSCWDAQAGDWLTRRGARYAAIGGPLDGAELVVRFPGDEDARIRPLTELLPLELVADRWRAADPEFAFSGRPGPA